MHPGHSPWNRAAVCPEPKKQTDRLSSLPLTFDRFSLPLVLAVLSLVMSLQTLAADHNIPWPIGWESSILPNPVDAQGQPAGSRQRAVLQNKDGKQIAVMEVTRVTALNEHPVSIENVIVTMRKALQLHYSRLGLLASCSRPTETSVGDLSGLQTTCNMTAQSDKVLTHTLVTAVGSHATYSLEYAAEPATFSEHLHEFVQLRKMLKLN
jgi:hypothetical protein